MNHLFNWLLTVTGTHIPAGQYSSWYNFFSGFGSDIMEFSILAVAYRKLNCHVDGCKRIGMHHVPGTPFITCRKHNPAVPKEITHLHIVKAHKEANK